MALPIPREDPVTRTRLLIFLSLLANDPLALGDMNGEQLRYPIVSTMTVKSSIFVLASASLAAGAVGFVSNVGKEPFSNAVPENPTYAEHIAPILNKHCVQCHRPGEVAPFPLIGYDNAKKWATMAKVVTGSRQMPPWKAKEGFGEFADSNRLSDVQVATIKKWEEMGSPRGDAKREPQAPTFASDWPLGKPDLTVSQKQPFKVDSEGTDEYRNFVIKTDYKEPRWVTAMDVKPGNARIVHHVIVFVDNRGQAEKLEAATKDGQEGYSTFGGVGFIPSGSFGGWAPGMRPRMLPTGKAFKLEPGARLVMQVHYNKSGKPETDLTKVGLYFAKSPVDQQVELAWFFNVFLRIPAGAKNHRQTYSQPIPADITVYGVMPHMHLLGKEMKAWAVKPDKGIIPLIHVVDWDFKWQLNYLFKEPVNIPKGSTVFVEAIYDNSAENPNNPSSPPRQVNVGEKTTDEMQLLVAAYTVDGLKAGDGKPTLKRTSGGR
jgi:mono/diheme cytochrome c family protein